MNDIQILEEMRDNLNGYLWEEDDYQMRAKAQQQFDALNWAIKKLKEKQPNDNVYRIENVLSGQGVAYRLQERAKDPNIIYLTNDTVMDTDTVKSLANYIEWLEDVCTNLNDNYISKQVIRDKVNEINKSMNVCCKTRASGKSMSQFLQFMKNVGLIEYLNQLLNKNNN